MKRKKSSETYRRERIIMIAGSALVLTAVTVAGVSVYRNGQPIEQEENIVDFSTLEDQQPDSTQAQNSDVQNYTSSDDLGELDYDPYYAAQDELLNGIRTKTGEESSSETESGAAKKNTQEESESGSEENQSNKQEDLLKDSTAVGYGEYSDGVLLGQDGEVFSTVDGNSVDVQVSENTNDQALSDTEGQTASGTDDQAAVLEAVANAMLEEQNLHFDEAANLSWPIVGNVVLNYSMDKTVYFQTLQQYKYNPSIVISAVQGANIACAADGVVKSVYQDPQTGGTVVMNLGNGYELTYGQLTDISVEQGDFVETGVYIGKVAAPTKYYTKEGTNVYFKLTKDQEPVNPLDYLG